MPKLTKKLLDSLKPRDGTDLFVWDSALTGFGVRVKPTGSASFLVQYRTPQRRTRRYAFAKLGTLTPDEARTKARQLLAQVEHGEDPSAQRHETREALTVTELCARYLEAARAGLVLTRFRKPKRPSTIINDVSRIARHIPRHLVLGREARNCQWGEPGAWLEKHRSEAKERVLSSDELARLGAVLQHEEMLRPMAVAAVRLIALTGLRREEACGLRWREIDQDGSCLRLSASKTGRSTRPLGKAASDHLRALPKLHDEFVFPNRDGS